MNPYHTQQRIACLWFPHWPLQRLTISHPELAKQPLLLIKQRDRGDYVEHANRLARQHQIVPGMPVAEARSLLPVDALVKVLPIAPDEDRASLSQLALECDCFCPCVSIEEGETPSCLLLDITGVSHFFGDEASLAATIDQSFSQQRYHLQIAIAPSVGSSWVAAHYFAQHRAPKIITSESWLSLCHAPLEGLRLSEGALSKLHRLGLRTIRELLALPRVTLLSRFGSEVGLRIDQFLGRQKELIIPLRPRREFKVMRTLEHGITQIQAIERLLLSLLEHLLKRLQDHQMGARHLHFQLIDEERRTLPLSLRLCTPTHDYDQIAALCRLQLERVCIRFPLVVFQIEALETLRLEGVAVELFAGSGQSISRPLASLINRLSSRLGAESVSHPHFVPDPIPECAYEFLSASSTSATPSVSFPHSLHPLDRPPYLLKHPEAIQVLCVAPEGAPGAIFLEGKQQEILQYTGPEKIESGWWNGPLVSRTYYRIITEAGRCFWIFRKEQDQQWFLHGEFL